MLKALDEITLTRCRVFNAFNLIEFPECSLDSHIHKLVDKLSDVLPANFLFQAPVSIAAKIIGKKKYSYTRDCLKLFSNDILVGYGVVGSAVSKVLRKKNISHLVVVSNKSNQFLGENGFVNTMIGRHHEGLSNYWHGAHVIRLANGDLEKKVPIFVNRSKAPRNALKAHVTDVVFQEDEIFLKMHHPQLSEVGAWSKRVHLAAGVLQNLELLSSHTSGTATLSDHELANVGTVSTNELKELGFLKCFLFLIYGRKVITRFINNRWMLFDFRQTTHKKYRSSGK